MPMASSRRAPPKRSSAGSWRWSRTRSGWTETTSAYRSPTSSSTASTGSRSADGTPDELKGKVSGDLVTFSVASEEHARTGAGIAERVPSVGSGRVAA